jgi:hypothetical protein
MTVFTALQKLKTNIFGGPGNTGFTKPPASRVQDINLQPSPTGLLSDDPLSYATFSYPLDVQNNFQNGHYMLFYVNVQNKTKYKYKSQAGKDIGDYTQYTTYDQRSQVTTVHETKGANAAEVAYQKGRAMKSGKQIGESRFIESGELTKDAKKGVTSAFNDTRRIQESIAIYLPPNVEDTTNAAYNDMRTGLAGFLAARGEQIASTQDAERIAKELLGAAGGVLSGAALRAVSEVAEMALGAEGTTQLVNKAFGQADNPYMEVLFDAMQLRTFTYNFIFAPKNEKETEEVQKIIQIFRFHMAPELRGGQSRFLGLPSQFDIHYMYLPMGQTNEAKENLYYNRIATCVLQNCVTNYTPDGVKSFEDGAPTKITMTLTFKETELLTKEKINQGF